MFKCTPETLRGLVNDVVFWSKHTNGKRVPKSMVVKAIINGNANKLRQYVVNAKSNKGISLKPGWHKPA